MRSISPYALGATLYMPAIHPDIPDIILGRKHPDLSSVVLCLEDALGENDVDAGLANIKAVLQLIARGEPHTERRTLVFIRPRHIAMARTMANWPEIVHVDGFVAPKVRPGHIEQWVRVVDGTGLFLMPTLETVEMFDAMAVRDFRDELLENEPQRMLALRIGGNDLMNCLGVRRQRGMTVYEGPLVYVISMLVSILGPAGFHMTAPVCEIIDDEQTLLMEVKRDVAFGMIGKTAIHPAQVAIIQEAFKVDIRDYEVARTVLADEAAAVFSLDGAMCEPATHRQWAERTIQRAAAYGLSHSNLNIIAA